MTRVTKRASGAACYLWPLAFFWHHCAHTAATAGQQFLQRTSDSSAVARVVDHFQLLLGTVVVVIMITITGKCAIQEVRTWWTAGYDATARVWTGTHRGTAGTLCLALHNWNRGNTRCQETTMAQASRYVRILTTRMLSYSRGNLLK
jgi:hypothetical protein